MFLILLGVWLSVSLMYWAVMFCIEPCLRNIFSLKNRRVFGLLLVTVTIYIHVVEYFPWA